MDPDSIQTARKCVTFMHSYCADPYSEANDGDKTASVEPRLVNPDSVCSVQTKIPGPSNSGLETSTASGKRSHIRSQSKADYPQEIFTFKIPLGNGEHHGEGEEGICDENSQKENRANNISGNPDCIVEDYGVPKNDVTAIKQGGKSSPTITNRNGHSEELNLMNHVPKNYSNNMDVLKIPTYDTEFLPGRCENIDMFIKKSDKLNPADSNSKFDVNIPFKFQCDICGKSFKKKNYLHMHLRSHDNLFATNQPVTDYLPIAVTGTEMDKIKNQYLCNICGNSFVRASNLRRHQSLHKKPKVSTKLTSQKNIMLKTVRNRQIQAGKSSQHRCFTCGHMFKKKIDLLLHQITHAPKKEIILKKKGKKNKSPVPMQQDSGEETDSATEGRTENNHSYMACVSDDASTDTADEFEDNSSPVKYFSCSECDLKFLFQNSYVKHMELHPELEEFECALCHVRFDCTSGLADHFASQCGEKRFRCDVCEQRFSRRATLMQHVQTHTKQVAHKCHLCRRPYNYLKYLKNHYLNHHRVEPHQCATCGKLFHTQSRLESHSLLHNHPHLKNGSVSLLQTHMLKHEDSDSDHCFADSEENQKVQLKRAKKTHRKKVSFQNEVQFRGIEIKSEPPFDMDYDDRNSDLYEMPSALPRLQKPRHRRKSLFLAPNLRLAHVPDPYELFQPPLSETSLQSHVETPMPDVNDSLHNGFHPSDDFSSPTSQPAPVNPAERLDWVINKVKISLKLPMHQEPEPLEEEPPYNDQEFSNTTATGFENSLEYPSQYFIGMDPLEAPNYDSVDSPIHLLAQVAEHLDNSRDFNVTQAPDLNMPINPPHENTDEPFQQEQEYEEEGCLSVIPPEVESSESPSFDIEMPHTQETLSDGDGENSHLEQEDSEEANSFNYEERLESLIQKVKMSVHQASSSVY